MRTRTLLLLAGLLLAAAPLAPRPSRAQGDLSAHSSPQTHLEGRIRSVSEDGGTFELDVYLSTTPSGFRKRFSQPVTHKFRLAKVCYIYNRYDRAAFLSPKDLKPGGVVVVQAVDGDGDELLAAEILVGGKLPTLAPAAPVQPENPENILLPPIRAGVAKFEPAHGCYLGAFVMHDEHVGCRMDEFERTVGKGHASYLRYVGYGKPFPSEWVEEVRRVGAVPNIAFEPNGGLRAVKDDDYLRKWAKAAGASGGPVFLRFGSEMNGTWTAYSGNPWLYRARFRLVAKIMRKLAPNVAMVWTPYCVPTGPIPEYYPGDDAVDWVGVNIYSVHHHDGRIDSPADQEDPAALLEPIYSRYASRKPIQISEYAATSFCQACGQAMPQFAIRKMQRLYSLLPTRFPRVKMIYWFSWDTIAGKAACNDYAVTGNPQVLKTYRQLTHSSYFLPRIREPKASGRGTETATRVGKG